MRARDPSSSCMGPEQPSPCVRVQPYTHAVQQLAAWDFRSYATLIDLVLVNTQITEYPDMTYKKSS